MCADGWAGIGWPVEYGGQGRSAIEQFVFFDESMRAGVPVPMLTINSVAPTIMRYGSDEQKQFFLPKILAGDIHFCIGYSEPGAGTDLASLTTRAVRDGDEYVINGQKMWTSLAADADYCWLAVRTNPEVKKHQGISLIILPMDTPGITVSPLDLLVDHDVNAGVPRRRPRPGRATASAARTTVGRSSPTSSTTSASRLCATGTPSARSPRCAVGAGHEAARTAGA